MLYAADMERKSQLGKRIADFRRMRKMTQADLARALKVTPQAVSGWERDESMPELDRIEAVAGALGVDIMQLMSGAGEASAIYLDQVQERERQDALSGRNLIPGREILREGDFPIYSSSEGGNGAIIVHTDVMEYIRRPTLLAGVPNAYGILVVGESMIPAYRPGDVALVHPGRPLARDTDVVIYQEDPRSGDTRSMIKHLLSFNDSQLRLEQYNPARPFGLARKDWPYVHQVAGKYNGLRNS